MPCSHLDKMLKEGWEWVGLDKSTFIDNDLNLKALWALTARNGRKKDHVALRYCPFCGEPMEKDGQHE